MMIIIASVLVSISVLLFFVGLAYMRTSGEMQQRMELYGGSFQGTIEERELQQPFSQRVLRPLMRRMLGLFAWILPNNRIAGLQQRLTMAGNPSGITTADFIGIKGWTTIIMGAVFVLYVYLGGGEMTLVTWLIGLVFVFIGFRLPDIWLSRQIATRQLELTNSMPDALDMMTIAVEAGLSFEQSLGEIVTRWDNDLAKEFRRVLYEVGVGMSRREALEHLSERTAVPDIVSFVTAINHSEELGTSLARVLNVQSQEMRIRRRQRAQEAANKVPIKILFPMVFLIFPAMFAVILGPAVPRIFRALGGVIGG
ncbi:MAG: type II secretion system F family protein [Chloroflexota bacterium]|nr:type II secretion system F family protein [Chloroflexota bacterium]